MPCYEYELVAVPVFGTRAPDYSKVSGMLTLQGVSVGGRKLRGFIETLDRKRICLPRNATAASSAAAVEHAVKQLLRGGDIEDVLVNDSRPTGDKNVWLTLGGHIYVHPVTSRTTKSAKIAYGKPALGLWSHAMVMLLPRPVTCVCPAAFASKGDRARG